MWTVLNKLAGKYQSITKGIYKFVFWYYVYKELKWTTVKHTDDHRGDKEIYNLLHNRSSSLLNYTSFLNEHPEVITVPNNIESIYISTKSDTPVTTWAHTSGADKITVMYVSNIVPAFMAIKYYHPFKELEKQFPEL